MVNGTKIVRGRSLRQVDVVLRAAIHRIEMLEARLDILTAPPKQERPKGKAKKE